MSYSTSQLITAFRSAFGEDSNPSSVDNATHVLGWLNESQRELCWEGDILLTCGRASTVAGQATYSLPPDYLRMSAVFIYRPASFTVTSCTGTGAGPTTIDTTVVNGFLGVAGGFTVTGTNDAGTAFSTTVSSVTDADTIIVAGAVTITGKTLTFTNPNGGLKTILEPIGITHRDPDRPQTTDQHSYYVWGENVNGMNQYVVGLEDVPSISSPYDIHCFYRQLPQEMAIGGVAPEVPFQWQDQLITGALYRAYRRLCLSDMKWYPLMMHAKGEWESVKVKARQYKNPYLLDRPRRLSYLNTRTNRYMYSEG